MNHQPPQIQDHHLNRLAIICHQEIHPQGGAKQPGSRAGLIYERHLAIHWGWPEKAILDIDAAWSMSGPGADSPDSFLGLYQLVAQKQIGIIMMSSTSSLSPSSSDLLRLFDLCRETDTLIAVDGAITDVDRQLHYLLTNIYANVFAVANRRRAEVTTRAKRHYAAKGRAVSNPPIGYIKVAKGQWAEDIPAVREQIEHVFRLYDTFGSVGKVVRFLLAKGL